MEAEAEAGSGGSGSTLMKEVGSGSALGSESVEKEPEAEAIFSKSGASGFSTCLQPFGMKCYNNNNNNKIESTTRAWYEMKNGMERKFWYGI